MGSYVLNLQEVDQTQVALVGGKGANLGELSRLEGLRVPAGFCVTTDAFKRMKAEAPSLDDRLERLSRLEPDDREAVRELSSEIRRTLETIAVPDDVASAIAHALVRPEEKKEQAAYAVRSSATAEDLPTASFAEQQDTYLNVRGEAAILQRVSRCWASLFTERAVTYRLRNGVDQRRVHMAVVVQQSAGEIDITRPRWSERPSTLVPILLGHIENFEPGAGKRRFAQGRQAALKKEHEVLERLRDLPDRDRKADEARQMIDRVRTFAGYREYPKYGMVSRYFVYKQALMKEAERLVEANVIRENDDIFYLRFEELHDVARTNHADEQLIRRRREEFKTYQTLTPPRVLTSEARSSRGRIDADDCRPARSSAYRASRSACAMSRMTRARPSTVPAETLAGRLCSGRLRRDSALAGPSTHRTSASAGSSVHRDPSPKTPSNPATLVVPMAARESLAAGCRRQ